MEGRTIARPNASMLAGLGYLWGCFNGRAGQLPGQTAPRRDASAPAPLASMEGRTIARPNDAYVCVVDVRLRASMEGRTIARPNPAVTAAAMSSVSSLQWRAGQLPGQTPRASGSLSPG